MDKIKTFIHLHIGKSGGTALDYSLKPIMNKLSFKYIGFRHFDWSYIEKYDNPYVLTILRHPVKRTISHFYFAKNLSWTKDHRIRKQTLSEYLDDPESMLETREVWQDGQASVSWLTGTHIANWVGIDKELIEEREKLSLDTEYILKLACKRLEETWWFGILENIEPAIEMLEYKLQNKINFAIKNQNNYPEPTEKEIKKLESIMYCDMYLYNYAKELFKFRYQSFKIFKPISFIHNSNIQLKPINKHHNKSTRYIIHFINYDSNSIYYVYPRINIELQDKQKILLPNIIK